MDNNKITTKSIGGSGFNNVTFKDGKATVYLGWKDELEEALLKISVGRNGKDWVDEPVDAIMEEISPVIESLLKKERIDEDRMWQEWITVRGSEPIPLKDINQRILELEGVSDE